jgi:ubiquinone/menaquinone biosynthesis C-methylase UbiE
MGHRVCPWWLGYFLLSPVRQLWQDPRALLAPHVKEGQTVLEPGPGMGFFTLELARLVGPAGRVVAIDVQPEMFPRLRRRAQRAGLLDRIETRLAVGPDLRIGDLAGKVQFALAFAVVHELPDVDAFFAQVAAALSPEGQLLVAEPRGRVSEAEFRQTLASAVTAGFRISNRPTVSRSRAALLARSRGGDVTAPEGANLPPHRGPS